MTSHSKVYPLGSHVNASRRLQRRIGEGDMALTIPKARIAGMECKITDIDYNLFWDNADSEEGIVKLTLRLTAQSEDPIALALEIEARLHGRS